MAHQTDNDLPLGARLLPGVDLRLWLQLVVSVCMGALVVTVLVVVGT